VGELTARTDLGVVVLEGAHLLYSPELMGKCDVILFLDIEESEAQRRRFGRRVPTDQSRQIAEMEYSKRCMIPHAARVNEIAQRNSVNLGGNVIKITVEDSFEIVVQHAFHHVPQFLLKK
jgi:pantothenate kinase